MRIHRYTQWDGTQQVLFPTTDDLLKHLSDHLLEEEGVRRALRDLMRRGFTSEDGQRSVKGMRDFLREADEKRRELLNKYSPDSFKLTPEEQKALSEKLNSLAEKLEKYHEQMRNFMERMSGKFADRMDELSQKMQEAYQRYQELRQRLQNQIAERGMQKQSNMSGQDPQSLMDMLDRMQKLLEDENFLKNLPSMMDAAVNNLENMLENLDSMTQEQLQQLSDMMNQMQQLEQLMNQFGFQGSQRMGMGEAGQILGQLRGLERFLRWHRDNDRELLGAEIGFTVDYGDDVVLRGRADRLERDADGGVVVVDLKTSKNPPKDKDLPTEPQLGVYQLAVREGAFAAEHPGPPGGAELVQLRQTNRGKVKVYNSKSNFNELTQQIANASQSPWLKAATSFKQPASPVRLQASPSRVQELRHRCRNGTTWTGSSRMRSGVGTVRGRGPRQTPMWRLLG